MSLLKIQKLPYSPAEIAIFRGSRSFVIAENEIDELVYMLNSYKYIERLRKHPVLEELIDGDPADTTAFA